MSDEYEWLGISYCLQNNLDIEKLIEQGWEFKGGALRLKKQNEPRSNRKERNE